MKHNYAVFNKAGMNFIGSPSWKKIAQDFFSRVWAYNQIKVSRYFFYELSYAGLQIKLRYTHF